MDFLRSEARGLDAYNEVVRVLRSARPPEQQKTKAKKSFIYDQTELIKQLRAELQMVGWTREALLAPEVQSEKIVLRRISADTLKYRVHTIFEFGNRSYYAYNIMTRVALGFATGAVGLAVFVLPTHRFAAAIDSNLVSFEQVAAELARLSAAMPRMIPGPTMLVGIEP
jgi:hypothetical protein